MRPLTSPAPGIPYPVETGIEVDAVDFGPVAPAISWGAILGGGVAAAALTLLLLALGSGLGLASMSPWPHEGASVGAFTIATGIWLIVVQWLSSGLGGYLTGRLRIRWLGTHTHEVFFRDTAHGFLTWAVASVVGALILAAAVGTGTIAAAGAASSTTAQQMREYGVESLFRGERPDGPNPDRYLRTETTHILANGMRAGAMPAEDRLYLVQLVAARTGVSPADAQKRLDQVIAQETDAATAARKLAETARKSAAELAIFTALSMLVGAFIASAAAALGGMERDKHA